MKRAATVLPWLPVLLATALGVTALWLTSLEPRASQPVDLVLIPILLTYGLVGGLIARREPGNAVGWLLSGLGLAMIASFFLSRYAVAGLDGAVPLPAPEIVGWFGWTWLVALAMPVFLAFVVPTGRPASPAWAGVMALVGAVFAFVIVIFAFGSPGESLDGSPDSVIPNPFYVPALEPIYEVVEEQFVIYLAVFGAGAAALAARFGGSRGVERQQLKWILFAIAVMGVTIGLANALPAPWGDLLFGVAWLSLPIALGVAILRYRLYDIDLVIKRTVTYATLSLLLVGVEITGILLLQQLLTPFTAGQGFAVAATTLVVAALFQPALRRIRAAVDRRFDRARYDAGRVADGFGARLRGRFELAELETELVDAANATLRPSLAWVWMRDDRPDRRPD